MPGVIDRTPPRSPVPPPFAMDADVCGRILPRLRRVTNAGEGSLLMKFGLVQSRVAHHL